MWPHRTRTGPAAVVVVRACGIPIPTLNNPLKNSSLKTIPPTPFVINVGQKRSSKATFENPHNEHFSNSPPQMWGTGVLRQKHRSELVSWRKYLNAGERILNQHIVKLSISQDIEVNESWTSRLVSWPQQHIPSPLPWWFRDLTVNCNSHLIPWVLKSALERQP